MDTTAIAISVGIPCLGLFFALLHVIICMHSSWDVKHVEWALLDERTADKLYMLFLNKRLDQIAAQRQGLAKFLRTSKYLAARAGLEARDNINVIEALRDLENLSYRKRVTTKSENRKRAITLPYYTMPVSA